MPSRKVVTLGFFRGILVVSAIFVFAIVGCVEAPTAKVADHAQSTGDDLTADEILAAVLQQYQDATTYQDKAVLYLSYRLEGRAIQEPHPWSIAWDRDGRYRADLFNAKVCCDAKKLSCYVFDIDTGNVDNQHVLVPAKGFAKLLDDPIARHFVSGSSELPLYEEDQQSNRLVPPMIGFVESGLMPTWLTKPNRVHRLEDDNSTGSNCYVIQCVEGDGNYRIWINQASGMIDQIDWPLQYLDSQILASKEVTELRFFVRYHEAVMNVPHPANQFDIKDRLAAKIVKRFVTLPEPLPSEMVGQRIKDLELLEAAGTKAEVNPPTESSALVWVVGSDALRIVDQLSALDAETRKAVSIVYSDDLLSDGQGKGFSPIKDLQASLKAAGLRGLYDPQMKASSELKLKSVPSFVVFDRDSRIQFAKPIDQDSWQQELTVAINRVAAGEDLAAEMKREYSKYLDNYHRQIANQGNGGMPVEMRVERSETQNVVSLDQLSEPAWVSSELKNPGNIHWQSSLRSAYVMDGWQTVVELDERGRTLARHRLDIPAGAAINRIRSIEVGGDVYFAAYGMLGKRVFVFDGDWKLLRQIPAVDDVGFASGFAVTQCRFDRASDAAGAALVFSNMRGGVFQWELGGEAVERKTEQAARGFCIVGSRLFAVVDGRLQIDGRDVVDLAGWKINAICGLMDSQSVCVLTGKNSAGAWRIAGVDEIGQLVWESAMDSQYLENEVQPLTSNGSMGIALCDRGKIMLFNHQGVIAKIATEREIFGVAVDDQAERLFLSNGQSVEAYTLRLSDSKFSPASVRIK